MSHEKHAPHDLSPGKNIEITIDDVAYGGDSVGKYNGLTVFVPYAVPGDRLEARTVEVKKNYATARINKIIEPSPFRFKPICPHFTVCGGCDWMNINYTEQKNRKLKILNYMLEKTGGISHIKAEKISGYDNPLFYRDRAQFKISGGASGMKIGYYRADTHEVVAIDRCYIVNDKINRIMDEVKKFLHAQKHVQVYDEKTGQGFLRHVAIRVNSKGEALVTIVATNGNLVANEWVTDLKETLKLMPDIKGVVLNINGTRGNRIFGDREALLYGDPYITEHFRGVNFRLGSNTFFQVNLPALASMTDFIGREIERNGEAPVVDMYGGVGALSLPFHEKVKSIVVIEIDRASVDAVARMAEEQGMDNVVSVQGDADNADAAILRKYRDCTMIVDPPRKGMGTASIEAVKKSGIKNIIYISCNPSTFSRDVALLKDAYDIAEIEALDMFPQTYHIEVLSRLRLKE